MGSYGAWMSSLYNNAARDLERAQKRIAELEREVARLKKNIVDEDARSAFHRGLYDK